LQARDYSAVQLEKAADGLWSGYATDSDRTYFAAEEVDDLVEPFESAFAGLVAGGGASGRLCMAATSLRRERIRCLIRQ